MTCPVLPRALALGVLLAAAGCSPRGPEALRRGDDALAAGRVAESIPLLERAVTDLPGDALAWSHLGLAYQSAGRPAEAQKAYLRALQYDRNLFGVYFNLGALEFEQGRWTEAERALRTYLGVEANRTNVVAWRMLGDALLAARQPDAAERTLTTAAVLAPQDAAVRNSLGLVLAQKRRWRDAQAQFTQATRLAPEDPAARLNLAIATQQLGDRRGALELYRAFLALTPPPAEAAAVRALVQQLEAQLNPAPVPPPAVAAATNRPPAATNLVRVATNAVRAATNPPAAARANPAAPPAPARTNTPAQAAIVANPPPTNPPPRPAPPVEVVRVEEAPPLKPARDPVAAVPDPAAKPPTPAGAGAATPSSQAPASPPATPSPPVAASGPGSAAPDGPRKTFWQRVSPVNWGNPVKWFRGSGGTNAPAPEPDLAAAAPPRSAPSPTLALPVVSNPPPRVAESSRPAPPSKPVVARYPRGTPPVVAPGNRVAAQVQAQAAANAPDRATVLAVWQRVVQLDPSWAEGWMQLGRTALEAGNLPPALKAGEALVTLDAQSAPAQQLFAAALARAGYPADAAEHLERAVVLAPGNAAAHLALAGLYARDLGEPDLARPQYQRVLELNPEHPQAAAIRLWLANNP